ncbi:MAG: methylated-DNA--[protein]-cysteine S-methyltransferase [Candidatus Latescibacteria bacterium]|jgi:methylated-DNA-[protein]-cysteine S-methyltransferase|nr:methylated-DNA--[protein]-cysteine S-methyltransferase [Candidatus Latescibacterota bacterium]
MPDETILSFGPGQVRVIWDGGRLVQISLEGTPPGREPPWNVELGEGVAPNPKVLALLEDLIGYLSGADVHPGRSAPLPAGTRFQQAVWAAAREIPRGQTRTYGWIADATGRLGAARAAGAALGRNPCPIVVPCHRVVGASGNLTGFAYGIEWKSALLELEGVRLGNCRSRLAEG